MLRSEIEILRDEMENADSVYGPTIADRLTAILDADPVAARRIIHAETIIGPENSKWQGRRFTTATCDDGSVWIGYYCPEWEWERLPDIPQDEVPDAEK